MKYEERYWERRYREGGNSGNGSIGECAQFKWEIINSYVKDLDDVIDVGCGDLRFWEGKQVKTYTGIDISRFIIERARLERPEWKFIKADATERIKHLQSNVVICLDLIYHIMEESDVESILRNLCHYSKKWIFIFTFIHGRYFSPGEVKKYKFEKQCRFHDMKRYLHIFKDFDLLGTYDHLYSPGGMLVFRRKQDSSSGRT